MKIVFSKSGATLVNTATNFEKPAFHACRPYRIASVEADSKNRYSSYQAITA
uniref:Uncharacterized protein n=1 Tax=Curvibacter symbiont subsp. Hydra magnipapillata TaxID=667019 RepID=C9YC17_CURXX|nr:hypothetical protein Csp_C22460 [Curvibacter putative symbiont of Hydra magnipapillata]